MRACTVQLEGVDLARCQVGQTYDLVTSVATSLIVMRYAEPVAEEPSRTRFNDTSRAGPARRETVSRLDLAGLGRRLRLAATNRIASAYESVPFRPPAGSAQKGSVEAALLCGPPLSVVLTRPPFTIGRRRHSSR